MKEKWLSFFLGLVLGIFLCFGYHTFIKTSSTLNPTSGRMWGWNFEMTDERLTQMAERMGISKEELQKEIDSGKDIRTIMQERWGFWWGTGSGSMRGNRTRTTQE